MIERLHPHTPMRFLLKACSCLLIVTFLCLDVTPSLYAAVPAAPERVSVDEKIPLLSSIQLTPELGTLEDSYEGRDGRLVILIEDAHAIPEAQNSILSLLLHFQQQYGLRLAGIEGAASNLDMNLFRSFPDDELLKHVFEGYTARGELPGAAAAALFGTLPCDYYGLEQWPLYEEGLRAFLRAVKQEPLISRRVSEAQAALEAEKEALYSSSLRQVDREVRSFYRHEQTLSGLLTALAAVRVPEEGSPVRLLWEELREENAGGEVLNQELLQAAARVRILADSGRLAAGEKARFYAAFQEYQTSHLAPEGFALFLEEFSVRQGESAKFSEMITALAQKGRRMRALEGAGFFKELESYIRRVKEGLFRSDAERVLDERSLALDRIERWGHLELSADDWKIVSKAALPEGLAPALFEAPRAFYENAIRRDEIFVKRMMEKMTASGARMSALVTGGFHTEGLQELLRERNLSYVRIRPAIHELPEINTYRDQMQGQFSWSSYFRQEAGSISPYKAFARHARDQLLSASGEETGLLLKAWRDELIREMAREGRITGVSRYTSFLDEVRSEEDRAGDPEWLQRVHQTAGGLRDLAAQGQVTEQNLVRLIGLAKTQSLVGAASDPSVFVSPDLVRGALQPVDLKSELRQPPLDESLRLEEVRKRTLGREAMYQAVAQALRDGKIVLMGEDHSQADHHAAFAEIADRLASEGVEFAVGLEVHQKYDPMLNDGALSARQMVRSLTAGKAPGRSVVRQWVDWALSQLFFGDMDQWMYGRIFQAIRRHHLPVIAIDDRPERSLGQSLQDSLNEIIAYRQRVPDTNKSMAESLAAGREKYGRQGVLVRVGSAHARESGIPAYLDRSAYETFHFGFSTVLDLPANISLDDLSTEMAAELMVDPRTFDHIVDLEGRFSKSELRSDEPQDANALIRKAGQLRRETIQYAKQGGQALDEGRFDEALSHFETAARAYIEAGKMRAKVIPFQNALFGFVDKQFFRAWIEETGIDDVFNWSRVKDFEFTIKTEENLYKVLLASLLLGSDYYRRSRPEITGWASKVYGEIPNPGALRPEDFRRLGRVQTTAGAATASDVFLYEHRPSGERYYVKFLGERALPELLGQWWFRRLGFSTLDQQPFVMDGYPAVISREVSGTATLFDYIFQTLVKPDFFQDEVVTDRLFPEAFSHQFRLAKLADITIQLRDAHLRNVMVRVDEKGRLLNEPPVFFDKERSFGFQTNPYTGEGIVYEPYRGAVPASVIESDQETNIGREPVFHSGTGVEALRPMAEVIASVTPEEITAAVQDVFGSLSFTPAQPGLTPAIIRARWAEAVASIRDRYGLHPELRSEPSQALDERVLEEELSAYLSSQASGHPDSRIVPSGEYHQGLLLGEARKIDFVRDGFQNLYDFIVFLNEQFGRVTLSQAFEKNPALEARRGLIEDQFIRFYRKLLNHPALESLSGAQLGGTVNLLVKALTGDSDPYSKVSGRIVTAFDRLIKPVSGTGLADRAGLPLVPKNDDGHLGPEAAETLYRSFVFTELSGAATDSLLAGTEKSVTALAQALGAAVPSDISWEDENRIQGFLDEAARQRNHDSGFAGEDALRWDAADPLEVKMMKLAVRHAEAHLPDRTVFQQWVDVLNQNPDQPVVYVPDNREYFPFQQIGIETLLRSGFSVIVIGREAPVLNDVTYDWLRDRLSRHPLFESRLFVVSSGTDTAGLDVAHLSPQANEALAAASSVVSTGNTNFESLVQRTGSESQNVALTLFSARPVSGAGKRLEMQFVLKRSELRPLQLLFKLITAASLGSMTVLSYAGWVELTRPGIQAQYPAVKKGPAYYDVYVDRLTKDGYYIGQTYNRKFIPYSLSHRQAAAEALMKAYKDGNIRYNDYDRVLRAYGEAATSSRQRVDALIYDKSAVNLAAQVEKMRADGVNIVESDKAKKLAVQITDAYLESLDAELKLQHALARAVLGMGVGNDTVSQFFSQVGDSSRLKAQIDAFENKLYHRYFRADPGDIQLKRVQKAFEDARMANLALLPGTVPILEARLKSARQTLVEAAGKAEGLEKDREAAIKKAAEYDKAILAVRRKLFGESLSDGGLNGEKRVLGEKQREYENAKQYTGARRMEAELVKVKKKILEVEREKQEAEDGKAVELKKAWKARLDYLDASPRKNEASARVRALESLLDTVESAVYQYRAWEKKKGGKKRSELRVSPEEQILVQGVAAAGVEQVQVFMDALYALTLDHEEEVAALPLIQFGKNLSRKTASEIDGMTAEEQIEQILDLPSSEQVLAAIQAALHFEGEDEDMTLLNPGLVALLRRQLTGALAELEPESPAAAEPLLAGEDAEFRADGNGRAVPIVMTLRWPGHGHEIKLRIKKEQRPNIRKSPPERVKLDKGWEYSVRVSGEELLGATVTVVPVVQEGPYVVQSAHVALGLVPGEFPGLQASLSEWFEELVGTPLTPSNPRLLRAELREDAAGRSVSLLETESLASRPELRFWKALIAVAVFWFFSAFSPAPIPSVLPQIAAQDYKKKPPQRPAYYEFYLEQITKPGYQVGFEKKLRPWTLEQRQAAAASLFKAVKDGIRYSDYDTVRIALEDGISKSTERIDGKVFDEELSGLAAKIEKMRADGVSVTESAEARKIAGQITDLYLEKIAPELKLQQTLARTILELGVYQDTVSRYLQYVTASRIKERTDHFEKFLYHRYFLADPKDVELARVQKAFRDSRAILIAGLKNVPAVLEVRETSAKTRLAEKAAALTKLEIEVKNAGTMVKEYEKELLKVQRKILGESLSDGGLKGELKALKQRQEEYEAAKKYQQVRELESAMADVSKKLRDVQREEQELKDGKSAQAKIVRDGTLKLFGARAAVKTAEAQFSEIRSLKTQVQELLKAADEEKKGKSELRALSGNNRLFYEVTRPVFGAYLNRIFAPLLSRGSVPVLTTRDGIFVSSVVSETLQTLAGVLQGGEYFVDLGSGLGSTLAIASHLGAGRAIGIESDEGLIRESRNFFHDVSTRAALLPEGTTRLREDAIEVVEGNFNQMDLATVDGRIPAEAPRVYFYYAYSQGARTRREIQEFLGRLRALPVGSLLVLYSLDGERDFTFEDLAVFGQPVSSSRDQDGFVTRVYRIPGPAGTGVRPAREQAVRSVIEPVVDNEFPVKPNRFKRSPAIRAILKALAAVEGPLEPADVTRAFQSKDAGLTFRQKGRAAELAAQLNTALGKSELRAEDQEEPLPELPQVTLLAPEHPAFASVFPPHLKGDDALLHASDALIAFAATAPGPFLIRLPLLRGEEKTWAQAGISPLDLSGALEAHIREHGIDVSTIQVAGDRLEVPLRVPSPGFKNHLVLKFGPLPIDQDFRRAVEKMNKRGNDASRQELFALVLTRFLTGTIREDLFSSIAGIPEDSDRDLLTGLGTTPELSAQLYSEAAWASHYSQQARLREAAEKKQEALGKKREREKALDALVEENRSEADALVDELLKLLEARAAIADSPLTVEGRGQLETNIRAAASVPVDLVESAKTGNSKVDEVRALITKRLGRLKRGLETEIYQSTEPLPVIVEAKRYADLGPEAAEAWLFRVASALSDEEVTEREQAVLVFSNHVEALSRMETRLERFNKLVRLGAPSVILENDRDLFMKSGSTLDMYGPVPRRRKTARQKFEHVLEIMDELSQTFAEDPGPSLDQDEETYRSWREGREQAARDFVEALRAEDNSGIQQTVYENRLTQMLALPEGNEEEIAEFVEAMYDQDPKYVISNLAYLLNNSRDLIRYYWVWWGLRIRATSLRKKIQEVLLLSKTVIRKDLDEELEENRLIDVEYSVPQYLEKLEKLIKLRDLEKNADEIFRILDAFQKLESKLTAPQQERVQAAMEAFDQKIEEGTRPRISASQRQEAERDLATARRKQKEAADEETFDGQLAAYQELFKGAAAYSPVFPEEALEIQRAAFQGALDAAQREQYRAEEAAPEALDGTSVERLSAQYSRVYDWLGRLELDSVPLTKQIVGIMDIIESAILELHLDYRIARAEAAKKRPARRAPAATTAAYPFSVVFTPKAYRQVLVRYQKDESFRRKFPHILEELMTKGVKGDAKLSNWMGLWGDRFDRDAYRIYWRPEGNRIHFVGLFHKDLTREKGRLGDVYLEHIASLNPSDLPVYDHTETDAFVSDVLALRTELREEDSLRPELREVSEDLIRFFRGLGNFSRERLRPVLEAPAAFADELETAALEIRTREDVERGFEARNHFQAILDISRPVAVDYEISTTDIEQMSGRREPVLAELLRTARDAIVANPHIGVRIRLPEGLLREAAQDFQALAHHRKDRVRHEISGGRLLLYHASASAEKLAAAKPTVTISSQPGRESQELVLGSSAYQDQTRVRYEGPEGVYTASRFLTAGFILAADALSEKTRGQLIQYDTGRFRAQSEEALHHLAAYVADLLSEHRASLISAAAA